MSGLKKYQFGVCGVLSVVFFAAIYPLSVSPYTGAYYVIVFNAISIIGFGVVLYCALTKSFTKDKITKLIWFLVISSLPHLLFALLSYGSWVCLGVAMVIVVILLWVRNRVHRSFVVGLRLMPPQGIDFGVSAFPSTEMYCKKKANMIHFVP